VTSDIFLVSTLCDAFTVDEAKAGWSNIAPDGTAREGRIVLDQRDCPGEIALARTGLWPGGGTA
jgi:hypothetical protein